MENSEQRMAELKKESEKEAQVKRKLAKEIESLKERESRGVEEKEVRRIAFSFFNVYI